MKIWPNLDNRQLLYSYGIYVLSKFNSNIGEEKLCNVV